jgi:hypothetical protein
MRSPGWVMPGIAGVNQPAAPSRVPTAGGQMITSMCSTRSYTSLETIRLQSSKSSPAGLLLRIPSPIASKRADVALLLSGECFSAPGALLKANATWLVHRYEERGRR